MLQESTRVELAAVNSPVRWWWITKLIKVPLAKMDNSRRDEFDNQLSVK